MAMRYENSATTTIRVSTRTSINLHSVENPYSAGRRDDGTYSPYSAGRSECRATFTNSTSHSERTPHRKDLGYIHPVTSTFLIL